MKNRYELAHIYLDFVDMIKIQFSQNIKVFRIDNAMEDRDMKFLRILFQNGTITHHSCLGTPNKMPSRA